MDHHIDVTRVVLAELVSADLVRTETADGAGSKEEDSLLVQIMKDWSAGVMEYWNDGSGPTLHYFKTPSLHS